ncbi:NAD(P)H-dependent oxidoreductase [Streptomyces profundus]|uniref:NAD(P)H-dependent oxidoreductase n=1 Tax=Streptomyces profundus TaxID=2867410 RepID=UPI001D169DBD|nr:NAD(P)H-dependent oxidoreductase [Streptomyces sp. MA3_2.13]UED87211.1 NAD(P)H-dependent oxidoreductase [Streptomyces sp. MA3_2.13]
MTTHDNAAGTGRKVLIVHAHPEPRSLTTSLASFAEAELRAAGHQVRTSDLYAMKWKASVDGDDYPAHDPAERLDVASASQLAFDGGTLTADVRAEQEKLLWADAVVFQFPLWWFSVPAILKGWFDRVFTAGFGYGDSSMPKYGDGTLAGRRALISVTIGAGEPSLSGRGIHGPLAEVLFPLQHGVLFFTGLTVLEPFPVHDATDLDEEGFARVTAAYRERLAGLFTERPVPYLSLRDEDYTRDLVLRPGRERPGTAGMSLHVG